MRWLSRRRRGSVGLEAAMAIPALLVTFGAVSQVMITAQSRMHLEQAAYAAARSALVHMCPPETGIISTINPTCDPDQVDPRKWLDAARWALVAASPTTSRSCSGVDAAHEILTGGDIGGRDQAAMSAVCYAFAPGVVTVDAGWIDPPGNWFEQLFAEDQAVMQATVTFQFPLSTPIRRLISDGEANGTHYKTGTATVVLQ